MGPGMDYIVRTPDQLGQYLKALRQARGESQAVIAHRLGVSQARYSAMERGSEKISVERLLSVLSALDVELVVRNKRDDRKQQPVRSPVEW